MPKYCLVKKEKIINGPRTLPRSQKNVSGFNLLNNERLKNYSWLPYIDLKPDYDEDTQYLTSIKKVNENDVSEIYTVNNYTAEEILDRIVTTQTTKKEVVRADAQSTILEEYPFWFQVNVANGIYDNTIGDPMKTHIINIIAESNRCESLVDTAITFAEVREIVPDFKQFASSTVTSGTLVEK